MKNISIFKLLKWSLFCLPVIVLSACSDDQNESNVIIDKHSQLKISPKPSLKWDESYNPYDIKTRSSENHGYEMVVTLNNIFLGAVYSESSVNKLEFEFIHNPVDPIDVSYTFPRYFFDVIERPSQGGMNRSLQKAIDSDRFSGKQSLSFAYDIAEFSCYSELKLAFRANVDIADIFGIDASYNKKKISSKSGLFARVIQKNFSMIMDYPYDGNIFLNNEDLDRLSYKNPLYINSITFGRMAIIAIESEYSYDELKKAFKLALKAKKVNGKLEVSEETKNILQEANMKLFVSGGASNDVAKIVEGFHEFENFIINGGEFTRDTPGVPISFTANYAENNSVFRSSYNIE